MIGQKKAPAIPDEMAVMERRAIATVPILNSVRAKIIAVPDTVATASDRRNQAMRKITICLSFAATLMVFHNESHANEQYARNARNLPPRELEGTRGGPGRGRSHTETGIVKENHQSPTRNKANRRGRVDETDVLDVI
jgi:hypothetical protein